LGKGGVSDDKREGDGATPEGCYPLRRVYYRPDHLTTPVCSLPKQAIEAADGWCDDPADVAYNRAVRLPYPASHEVLWRDDRLYDLLVVIGHNDAPPQPGKGSAIFMHVARPGYLPTEGCVALALADLQALLAMVQEGDRLCVSPRAFSL
jgi:L,D-peptidoglycan transpeptidase YkuD (ErfK/YbiS/YcfS/YnhG family)